MLTTIKISSRVTATGSLKNTARNNDFNLTPPIDRLRGKCRINIAFPPFRSHTECKKRRFIV